MHEKLQHSFYYGCYDVSKKISIWKSKTSDLQKVGRFKHIDNIASIQRQLSTVQKVHNSIQTNVGQADQLHLQ